jgi:shikimate kinase
MTVVEPTDRAVALRRPLVLVGMMGSGKSTVGKRLASVLDVAFVDCDAEVERRAGRTVAEIFAADGEPAFRRTEAAVVAELVAAGHPTVIATGGGAVLDAGTRALLGDRASVVWLRASPGMLAHRIAADGTRPLLADDPDQALRRLVAERDPLYLEVADHIVDVDHVARKVVVERVLDALTADRGAAR